MSGFLAYLVLFSLCNLEKIWLVAKELRRKNVAVIFTFPHMVRLYYVAFKYVYTVLNPYGRINMYQYLLYIFVPYFTNWRQKISSRLVKTPQFKHKQDLLACAQYYS